MVQGGFQNYSSKGASWGQQSNQRAPPPSSSNGAPPGWNPDAGMHTSWGQQSGTGDSGSWRGGYSAMPPPVPALPPPSAYDQGPPPSWGPGGAMQLALGGPPPTPTDSYHNSCQHSYSNGSGPSPQSGGYGNAQLAIRGGSNDPNSPTSIQSYGDGRTDVQIHIHGLDELRGINKDNDELEDLRRLVAELTAKNKQLRSGGHESTKEADDQLAKALNDLRHRVSCMEDRVDDPPAESRGRGGRAGRFRSSMDSTWTISHNMSIAAPGGGSSPIHHDLLEHRKEHAPPASSTGELYGDHDHFRPRASTRASIFGDLTHLRSEL